jgi:hypothetical protein
MFADQVVADGVGALEHRVMEQGLSVFAAGGVQGALAKQKEENGKL